MIEWNHLLKNTMNYKGKEKKMWKDFMYFQYHSELDFHKWSGIWMESILYKEKIVWWLEGHNLLFMNMNAQASRTLYYIF